MPADTFSRTPHRRYNPLTGEWVLVSPQRTLRPWLGALEQDSEEERLSLDPSCYLCPGGERAGGAKNPDYSGVFIFDNDFPALTSSSESILSAPAESAEISGSSLDPLLRDSLLRAEPVKGICRVICYSPRHDLNLARMTRSSILGVVSAFVDQTAELSKRSGISYVQIFENHGEAMGCSNPHPHGQIWASSNLPNLPRTETYAQENYLHQRGSCLLCDYLAREKREGERVLFSNASFTALVPFWATWPFETLILPNLHISSLLELTERQKIDLVEILQRMGICFDNLFLTDFPYSMGIHQKPWDREDYGFWHLHLHYYPPLLRSARIKKFMVGYELLAMPQRDLTPEASAERLRSLPTEHYLAKDRRNEG